MQDTRHAGQPIAGRRSTLNSEDASRGLVGMAVCRHADMLKLR
jgi:hypothetical protein